MICNASPLIFLARINQLTLLRKVVGVVVIPKSVMGEVLVENKEGYTMIKEALDVGWIKVINPKKEINLGIGKGENAAISLARERKKPIIIDDAVAVKIAKSFNLEVIRTTTIILMAIKKKIITKKQANSLIDKLIDFGYYISPKYYAELLKKLN